LAIPTQCERVPNKGSDEIGELGEWVVAAMQAFREAAAERGGALSSEEEGDACWVGGKGMTGARTSNLNKARAKTKMSRPTPSARRGESVGWRRACDARYQPTDVGGEPFSPVETHGGGGYSGNIQTRPQQKKKKNPTTGALGVDLGRLCDRAAHYSARKQKILFEPRRRFGRGGKRRATGPESAKKVECLNRRGIAIST